MALDLEARLPHIAALCRRHAVRQLDVFGSAVRHGEAAPLLADVQGLLDRLDALDTGGPA